MSSGSGKKKPITGYIKLTLPAGKANPSPPVGPALGQKGVNIMAFCKEFNEVTASFESGMPVPVLITVYVDKSFSFVVKSAPASWFLKKYSGVAKGSGLPSRVFMGHVSLEDVMKIAELKIKDMNSSSIEQAMRCIIGTARSMGIEIKE